jgi:hypothetical protein
MYIQYINLLENSGGVLVKKNGGGLTCIPDKCFTLHITRKRKTGEYNYMLHDHKLEVTTDSKYLGVTISNDLIWGTHIRGISAKANRTISFLRRDIHSCPKVVKAAAYTIN